MIMIRIIKKKIIMKMKIENAFTLRKIYLHFETETSDKTGSPLANADSEGSNPSVSTKVDKSILVGSREFFLGVLCFSK